MSLGLCSVPMSLCFSVRLNKDHWECIPEYKERMGKGRGSGDAAGKKNTAEGPAGGGGKAGGDGMKKEVTGMYKVDNSPPTLGGRGELIQR